MKRIQKYKEPRQVEFKVLCEDTEESQYGIAYKNKVICGCCGGVYKLKQVKIIRVLDWIDIREEICGEDEALDFITGCRG